MKIGFLLSVFPFSALSAFTLQLDNLQQQEECLSPIEREQPPFPH